MFEKLFITVSVNGQLSVDYSWKIGKDIEVITGYYFLVLIWKMFVKISPVGVMFSQNARSNFSFYSGMFGVSPLLISPVEGSLFKSSLLS
jgi:hypothetical protein